MSRIDDACQKAAELVAALVDYPECVEVGGGNQELHCLTRESRRELTRAEVSRGWSRRPYDAYDSDKLCLSCRSLWYAQMARQSIDRYRTLFCRGAERPEPEGEDADRN